MDRMNHPGASFAGRAIADRDLPARVEWMNHPFIYESMNIEPPIRLPEALEWFQRNKRNPARRDVVFETRESPDGPPRLVAMGGLTEIHPVWRNAEVYVFTCPDASGHGYGRRAVSWLLDLGFADLGLWRIYLWAFATNRRAIELYSSLGFVREGLLRRHCVHRGQRVDRVVMGLLREEWERTGAGER